MTDLVRHIGLETFLAELADEIEAAFKCWEDFEKTTRFGSSSDHGVIELMPISNPEMYGYKYVTCHPQNKAKGQQTVTAFGMLSDLESGSPRLLSEMTLLTALRTAATSAMAARHLGPAQPRTMAVIGNGAQAEFQCMAFKVMSGIDTIRLYDIDPLATQKCERNLSGRDLSVVVCKTAAEATVGADIITTCTADMRHATILTDNMVGQGVHLNAIGGDCLGKTELARDILLRSNIFVEFTPQTRMEGEIQQLGPDHPVTELWQVMTGEAPGRTSSDQITLFDSVGFAIEDFAALRYVLKAITKTGFHTPLQMVADRQDPRDLFGLLQHS